MGGLKNRIVKTKTKRGKRFLENREPKVVENVKKAMFVKGGRTNEVVTKALKEFEYLTQKNDHSLFMFGFNSKKRPNSLIVGRFFDNQVLDMFEFCIKNFVPMEDFKTGKVTLGIKPVLVFSGEPFATDPDFTRLKCLLTDFFRGEVVDNIRLQGLEHVLSFTAVDGKVLLRSYKTTYLKSGGKVPEVELTEIGPSFDFLVRRSKLASDDLYKKSMKQPREIEPKKKKNISKDAFGSTLGRVHMQRQDLNKLQVRKVKAFKRKLDTKPEEAKDEATENGGGEKSNGQGKKKKIKKSTENGSYDE